MTKLMEWLLVFTVLVSIWTALVTNTIENEFSKKYMFLIIPSPLIFVILFGLYAASVVLYRVFTFNDCKEAAKELQKEIEDARADLKQLGFKFKTK